MGHIFVSYSHKNTAYAYHLAEALQKKGFEVWIDERLDYGSQWPLEIQKQLDTCAAFIVIMSPPAFSSEWVQNELSRAKRKQKQIFPLLLEGDEPWLTVESTQFIDVRGGELPPEKFYECLKEAMSGQQSPALPVQPAPVKKEPKPIKFRVPLKAAGIFSVLLVLLGIGLWGMSKLFSHQTASIDSPVMATIDDAYTIRGGGAPILEDKAYNAQPPADVFKPGTVKIFVSLKPSDQVIWSYDWCAADKKTLENNLKAMKVQFILNGSQISGLFLAQLDYQTKDMSCHSFFTALHDWPAGTHHLTIKSVLATPINDGGDDYQAGEYLINYTVDVKP